MKECPCGYGLLYKALVKKTNKIIYICGECDNTWPVDKEINRENAVDFDHYAEKNGIKPLWNELILLNDAFLIKNKNWGNSKFVGMDVDADNLVVRILDSDGSIHKIKCEHYIGFEFIGYWGKTIIKNVTVSLMSEFTSLIHDKIKLNHPNELYTDKYRNIDDTWYEVNVEFTDNNCMKISCWDAYLVNHKYDTI